jgi:hypothetical protein
MMSKDRTIYPGDMLRRNDEVYLVIGVQDMLNTGPVYFEVTYLHSNGSVSINNYVSKEEASSSFSVISL